MLVQWVVFGDVEVRCFGYELGSEVDFGALGVLGSGDHEWVWYGVVEVGVVVGFGMVEWGYVFICYYHVERVMFFFG